MHSVDVYKQTKDMHDSCICHLLADELRKMPATGQDALKIDDAHELVEFQGCLAKEQRRCTTKPTGETMEIREDAA